jgi:hypothetical protein
MSGVEPHRERLAVHARQLVVEPRLQILRRRRRLLLPCLEQAHRSAVAHHVHRTARLGARVLISGTWYSADSAILNGEDWVEGFEFGAGFVGFELPVGFGLMLVAVDDPYGDLLAQGGQIADASVETLRGEDAEFAFCYVEPASVLWRVMPIEALGQAARFLGRKCLVFQKIALYGLVANPRKIHLASRA